MPGLALQVLDGKGLQLLRSPCTLRGSRFPHLFLKPRKHGFVGMKNWILPKHLFEDWSYGLCQRDLLPGDVVEVRSFEKKLLAYGFFEDDANNNNNNNNSNHQRQQQGKQGHVAAFHWMRPGSAELPEINSSFFEHRVAQALTNRRQFMGSKLGTSCFRVINGAHDGFPHMTLDVFGNCALVRCSSSGAERMLSGVYKGFSSASSASLSCRGGGAAGAMPALENVILMLRNGQIGSQKPLLNHTFQEFGNSYELELDWAQHQEGKQKQHEEHHHLRCANRRALLDPRHRVARSVLAEFCAGKHVLDCCSAQGACAVTMAAGMAKEIHYAHPDAGCLDAARRAFQRNNAAAAHSLGVAQSTTAAAQQRVKSDFRLLDDSFFSPTSSSNSNDDGGQQQYNVVVWEYDNSRITADAKRKMLSALVARLKCREGSSSVLCLLSNGAQQRKKTPLTAHEEKIDDDDDGDDESTSRIVAAVCREQMKNASVIRYIDASVDFPRRSPFLVDADGGGLLGSNPYEDELSLSATFYRVTSLS